MPIVFRERVNEHTEYGIWRIREDSEQLYRRLQLDDREKAIFDSMKNQHKRSLHWMGSRVLLRELLGTDKYINLKIGENGKPFLANFPHQISISHSYDFAAVMISTQGSVGIDIEQINTKVERIASRFLTPSELDSIPAGKPDYYQKLYACWSAKEAVYKWHGKGGLAFYGGIVLHPFDFTECGEIIADVDLFDGTTRISVKYREFEGYMVAWCC